MGGRSAQVCLCCCLQDLEALARLCLVVVLAHALRLRADPIVNLERWGLSSLWQVATLEHKSFAVQPAPL